MSQSDKGMDIPKAVWMAIDVLKRQDVAHDSHTVYVDGTGWFLYRNFLHDDTFEVVATRVLFASEMVDLPTGCQHADHLAAARDGFLSHCANAIVAAERERDEALEELSELRAAVKRMYDGAECCARRAGINTDGLPDA